MLLWSPYEIGQTIICLPCDFYLLSLWSPYVIGQTIYIFILFMVALWNRADHYIFILFLLSSSFLFPGLISAVGNWMSTILPHKVWP